MTNHPVVSRPLQSRFLTIPQAPLCYWLRERFFELLAGKTLGDMAEVRQGLATANDSRFVRFTWELPLGSKRWVAFTKGGGYCKWFGQNWFHTDWEYDGARLRIFERSVIRNPDAYFKPGWSYSLICRGSLSVRSFDIPGCIGHKGPGIYGADDTTLAVLQSRVISFLLRALSPQLAFEIRTVLLSPLPENTLPQLSPVATCADKYKQRIISENLIERNFKSTGSNLNISATAVALHTLEGYAERLVFDAYGLDANDSAIVVDETGTPAGWFPLIEGYDILPTFPEEVPELPGEVLLSLTCHERRALSPQNLQDLKRRLRLLYEAGPGAKEESDDAEDTTTEEDEEEEVVVGARISIPAETFLEELSQKLEVHPISLYWLLAEGVGNEGWRCPLEEQRIIADRFSVIILRLLGHRWPKQVEAGEPVPEWADPDGIIPLIQGTGEPTLFDRVLERAAARYAPHPGGEREIEREFAEVMGKPLDQWLTTEFFGRHVKQFKKHPIAWQLQRGPFTARKQPAFSCLVYTHKLDGATLTTIQSQYVRPLRQRYETELRNLESIPIASRSEQQESRRVQLEALIADLHDFDAALEQVTREGFGPENLLATLRQYAIDDAMLALKARWLRRLSGSLAPEPLATWQSKAIGVDLHPSLHQWIAEALSHLDRYCAVVGPATADAADLPEDPTAADVAALIGPHAQSMRKASLQLACAAWWKSFREAVLDPIDERIKDANDRIKALDAEMKHAPAPSTERIEDLQQRKKTLRAQVQPWKLEKEQKITAAKTIRETIEAWDCPEALTWEPWLAAQPLYDRIASIDGTRRPPQTIKDFIAQERSYIPDVNDGVRVNIAPLQQAALLAADVLTTKDVDKAIADRAEWRADERRWCREGRLPRPGWWPTEETT